MFCDFPKYKHLKQTIFRGPGGTGSATSDSDTTEFQEFLVQSQAARDAALAAQVAAELAETNAETAETNAETAATNAASSASAASASATNASNSASSASTSATNAATSATAAAASATAAAASAASIDDVSLVHKSGAETITGTKTFNANQVISVTDNTNAALRITQTGTGNAFVVEDSTSPDASPFVIDASGNTAVGSEIVATALSGSTPKFSVNGTSLATATQATTNWGNSASSPVCVLSKSRGGTTGVHTIVQSGDGLGAVAGLGSDGTNFVQSARIDFQVDGTPGTNDMPGRLVLSTTADGASSPTERVRINNSGAVGLAGANFGTSGQMLMSQGSAASPVWANVGIGFRNRIINGDMRIDQRNAGASVTALTTTSYLLDRWSVAVSQSSKFSVQQNAGAVTPPTGFSNYLGITSLSAYSLLATDYFILSQAVEGFNISDLAWGTASASAVTLSFQVRSSLTGTFGGCITNGTRVYPFTYSVPAANTWTAISFTVPGDTSGTWSSTNSAGLIVQFGLGVGSNRSGTAGAWATAVQNSATGATSVVGTNGATFYITGVQLEAGTVASPFERRDYGRELMMCQRYFQIIPFSGTAATTTEAGISGPYKVTMRASPSLSSTIYSGLGYSGTINNLSTVGIGNTAIGSVSFGAISENTVATIMGTGFTAGRIYFGSTIASAEL